MSGGAGRPRAGMELAQSANASENLCRLFEALEHLRELHDAARADVTLDAVVSALRAFWPMPPELSDREISLDEFLAILAAKGWIASDVVDAAASLVEVVARHDYDWPAEEDVTLNEDARDSLVAALASLAKRLAKRLKKEGR